jgi:hypothetical protein
VFLPYFDCYLYFYYLFLLFAFFLIFSRLLELYFLSRPGNSIIVINETTTLKKTKEQSLLQVVLSKWEDNLLNDIFWVSRKKFQGPLNHYFRAFPPFVFWFLYFSVPAGQEWSRRHSKGVAWFLVKPQQRRNWIQENGHWISGWHERVSDNGQAWKTRRRISYFVWAVKREWRPPSRVRHCSGRYYEMKGRCVGLWRARQFTFRRERATNHANRTTKKGFLAAVISAAGELGKEVKRRKRFTGSPCFLPDSSIVCYTHITTKSFRLLT